MSLLKSPDKRYENNIHIAFDSKAIGLKSLSSGNKWDNQRSPLIKGSILMNNQPTASIIRHFSTIDAPERIDKKACTESIGILKRPDIFFYHLLRCDLWSRQSGGH